MKFIRRGRVYQLQIENGNDLKDALSLDIALWVAISAPISAFVCDKKFLTLLNTNKDGNITSEELKNGITWLLDQLPDHASITDAFDGYIPLSTINSSTEAGSALIKSAEYILNDLECADKTRIDLDTIRKFQDVVKTRPLDGDGVISVLSASVCKDESKAEALKNFIEAAAKATGGTMDVDGTLGVTEDQFLAFWNAIPEYLAWCEKGDIPAGSDNTAVMMFGAGTPSVYALFQEHDADVRNFFRLCQLLAFDARLSGKGLSTDGKVGDFDPSDTGNLDGYLTGLPISQANAACELPVDPARINPIFRAWWADVTAKLIVPILGDAKTVITLDDWNTIAAQLAPYGQYLGSQAGAICAGLDRAQLAAFATESTFPELAHDLAVRDSEVAKTLNDAQEVERLLLYRRWMLRFANNFISFSDLYDVNRHAMFERGSVVIDGRWFNVAFPVDNVGAHSAVAQNGNIFVLYLDIEHPDGKVQQVTCPVTIGSKGNLQAGKRGVFFDFEGKQFPAKVSKVVENPICVAEALVAPFIKAGKMIEGKIEAWSSASEKNFEDKFGTAITPDAAAAAPAPDASKKGADKSGMLLGVSVAFAALGSAVAFISKTLSGMSASAIWVSVLCVLLALMLPISILAILKLRRQDLSLLLEGNGWAINSRMRLTNRLRRHFSRNGRFPKNAEGTPCKRFIRIVLTLVLIAAVIVGAIYGWRRWKECQACEQGLAAPAADVQEQAAEAEAEEGPSILENIVEAASDGLEAAKEAAEDAAPAAE